MYELNMDLFENGEPEKFIFFVQICRTTLEVSRTLTTCANIQYLRTLLHEEELCEFETLCIHSGEPIDGHLK